MRFGIGEKSDHTLEEVGQDFESPRAHPAIEAKALRKAAPPFAQQATQGVRRKLISVHPCGPTEVRIGYATESLIMPAEIRGFATDWIDLP